MPDDHSKLAPLLPISNRTVKRLSADDSAGSRVKVGHCQALMPKTPNQKWLGVFLCSFTLQSTMSYATATNPMHGLRYSFGTWVTQTSRPQFLMRSSNFNCVIHAAKFSRRLIWANHRETRCIWESYSRSSFVGSILRYHPLSNASRS
jgi:hypothetical protein